MAKHQTGMPKPSAVLSKAAAKVQLAFERARMAHQQGQLAQAQNLYESVLKMQPMHFDCLNLLAQLSYQCGKYQRAFDLLARAIASNPKIAASYSNIGLVLLALGRRDEALANYDKALALNPDYAEAHSNRGNVLNDLKRYDEALESFEKAIAINPHLAEACNNRGNALYDLKRYDEALASYDEALAINPRYVEAHNNRGNVFLSVRRPDEAIACYHKALAINPHYAEAHNNLGNAFQYLRQTTNALACYDKALAAKPDYALAYNNCGNALRELKRLDEALTCYDKALSCKADYAEAYSNRGNVLVDSRRLDEALASYEKAWELDPDHEFLFGTLLHTRMKLCDWDRLPEMLRQFESDIANAKRVTVPFPALGLMDSPQLLRQISSVYVEAKYPQSALCVGNGKRSSNGRIRVGYFSADFHNHATAYLMAELFEVHNAEKFEFTGFSYGPDIQDEMRQRLSRSFAQFIDVRDRSDREVARLAREIGIDIAVDLKGFTQDNRFGIFVERCAPVQVSYLGYPGTTGSDCMDYVIADNSLIPEDSRAHFSEKVVYLPFSYQVNDSKRKIATRRLTRREAGLPEAGFVFCCFNNNYKILPATFDGWMRILKAVEGSVLWLFEDNATAAGNLRKEAERRGVAGSRLVFATRMPLDEHLARHALADLFIDTLPYNAHTTASDALWAGLPVLTCVGKSFAGRVAASLLNAIDLPELVTHSQEEYEAKAVALAQDIGSLRALKARLERNKLATPLFDVKLFAKHIEAAYEAMFDRYRSDLPPEHIFVAP